MDEEAALDDLTIALVGAVGTGSRGTPDARRACRRLVQSITKREDSFMRPTAVFVRGVAFADSSNWDAETSCT